MSSNTRTATLSSTSSILFAVSLLAGLIRSGGLSAPDPSVLIHLKGNHSAGPFEIYTNAAGPKSGTNTDENSGEEFSYTRVFTELAGMMCSCAVAVTLANSWKSNGSTFKADTRLAAGFQVDNGQSVRAAPQPTETETACQPQVSQAELEWISAARVGTIRLTDDVFCTAMQWWLEKPLPSTVDGMGTKDQQLLRPVVGLLQQGREKEACNLMEQVGRLDRIERALPQERARSRSPQPPGIGVVSPLDRNAPDLATSAALLRNAVESYRVSPSEDTMGSPPHVRRGREEKPLVQGFDARAGDTPTSWPTRFDIGFELDDPFGSACGA